MNHDASVLRRRGPALREAVFSATLAEIVSVGVRQTTMAGVAKRASTGKAALYRRWPNIDALVQEVFLETMRNATVAIQVNTGSFSNDIRNFYRSLAHSFNSTWGAALRALISDAAHHPELMLTIRDYMVADLGNVMQSILDQAVARSEITVETCDPLLLLVAPSIIFHQYMVNQSAPDNSDIDLIVDTIVMPLVLLRSEELLVPYGVS